MGGEDARPFITQFLKKNCTGSALHSVILPTGAVHGLPGQATRREADEVSERLPRGTHGNRVHGHWH